MKKVILGISLLLSTVAFADDYYCGSIQATTGITGEQLVQLTTDSGVFTVVSGPTETLSVQYKLNSLKKSLKAESVCVKTLIPIMDDTIYAYGFTPFEP